jgi:ABC-2 type transport system ATP-binding protein
VIELDSVTKHFGPSKALRGVSFCVPTGCVLGLIGPNGSGKTTALRLILGLLEPTSGRLRVFGEPPTGTTADRIGYLPEERGLYRRMSVRDVLVYYARLKDVQPSQADIDGWLERLGIGRFIDTEVQHLSKGTAQKVQLIATVLHRPELVILDEPFSGLDPVSQDLVRRVIGELSASGATVILSTHDMPVAERMCDSVVMLHQGHKVLDGPLPSMDRGQLATIKVVVADGMPDVGLLPGVREVVASGTEHELVLLPGAEPDRILGVLMRHCEVVRFELARPSLHDVFLRLAARRLGSVPPQVGHA